MKFMELSSNRSFWRGIDYHHENRVIEWKKIDDIHYSGKVKGSDNNVYDVTIDISRPRRSKCNCPFAQGRYVVCKHMIALYLAIFPEKEKEWMDYIEEQNSMYEEEEYDDEYYDGYEEEEQYIKLDENKEELKKEIIKYVLNLSEDEAKRLLIGRMFADLCEED